MEYVRQGAPHSNSAGNGARRAQKKVPRVETQAAPLLDALVLRRERKILHRNAVATRFSRARIPTWGCLSPGLCDPTVDSGPEGPDGGYTRGRSYIGTQRTFLSAHGKYTSAARTWQRMCRPASEPAGQHAHRTSPPGARQGRSLARIAGSTALSYCAASRCGRGTPCGRRDRVLELLVRPGTKGRLGQSADLVS